jgi:hypothetical protein
MSSNVRRGGGGFLKPTIGKVVLTVSFFFLTWLVSLLIYASVMSAVDNPETDSIPISFLIIGVLLMWPLMVVDYFDIESVTPFDSALLIVTPFDPALLIISMVVFWWYVLSCILVTVYRRIRPYGRWKLFGRFSKKAG